MSINKIIKIEGMHCDGCVSTTTTALSHVAGIEDVVVSLESHEARLTLAHDIEERVLDAALRDAGEYRLAENGADRSPEVGESQPTESLYPLVLIVAYLLGAVLLLAWVTQAWAASTMMRHFMAGFFLVFSFFKLLDLRGFVEAYRGYDLVAKSIRSWAWAYPFIELTLGVAYLTGLMPITTNVATFVIMAVGAVGVLKALLNKRAIRCACLGTALNLPMTTVTLIEDISMAAMALGMLVVL